MVFSAIIWYPSSLSPSRYTNLKLQDHRLKRHCSKMEVMWEGLFELWLHLRSVVLSPWTSSRLLRKAVCWLKAFFNPQFSCTIRYDLHDIHHPSVPNRKLKVGLPFIPNCNKFFLKLATSPKSVLTPTSSYQGSDGYSKATVHNQRTANACHPTPVQGHQTDLRTINHD